MVLSPPLLIVRHQPGQKCDAPLTVVRNVRIQRNCALSVRMKRFAPPLIRPRVT